MKLLNLLKNAQTIALDTAPFIYFIEDGKKQSSIECQYERREMQTARTTLAKPRRGQEP